MKALVIGIEVQDTDSIKNTLNVHCGDQGFHAVAVPLVRPAFAAAQQQRAQPFARSELVLSSSAWTASVVGKLAEWCDVDAANSELAQRSLRMYEAEMNWAAHLSLSSLILPTPRAFRSPCYANCVSQTLGARLGVAQLWLRIPLRLPSPSSAASPSSSSSSPSPAAKGSYKAAAMASAPSASAPATGPAVGAGSSEAAVENDPWEMWNRFRTMCEHHPNLYVALELVAKLPPASELARWLGEPVRCVVVPTSVFVANKAGFLVLPKAHQEFVRRLMRLGCVFLVKPDDTRAAGAAEMPEDAAVQCLQYLQHLRDKFPPFADSELQEIPYMDYLQSPLQPLMDNLENQTYETFERDGTKYTQYEEAVFRALQDKQRDKTLAVESARPGSSSNNSNNKTTVAVIYVVGAGRGPLVKASLRAAARAGQAVRIYAVEKNPNAVITLQNMRDELQWGATVTVVDSDMRSWSAPELADIIVSELLGSFGDNELSPECLDGVQRFLKPGVGVSIPSAYTSYLAPLMSSRLYNEVRAFKDIKQFDTPFVVRFLNVHILADSKPCFTFVHPNPQNPIDNERRISLTFTHADPALGATLHGFAGYFDATLYADVHVSINPATHTPGMFSWFPLYFPVREPVYLPPGATVGVTLLRKVGRAKVWYEWCITDPVCAFFQNLNGSAYAIGL